MVIKQKLNVEDVIKLNMHIFKQNKKLTYNMALVGIFSMIAAVFCFIKQNIPLAIFFICVGLFGVLVLPYIYKILIKKNVYKKMKDVNWEINVTIDNDNIYYAFSHEDLNNIDPYTFKEVLCANEYKNHIFIKINTQVVLMINKSFVENLDELHKLLEDKLILDSRYFVNLKKDY